jgi:DNA-3-methyladenine glycosylase II
LSTVLVREVARPRWTYRLGPPSLEGLTRRRGNGLVRLPHVGDEPVVVAVSGVVFAARAASEDVAREGIARMRFALGVDDDLSGFYERFRDDPLIGRAVRARPWLRARRNPDPWETLMWSITEQLIEMTRAVGIQRRMVRMLGRGYAGFRDSPSAQAIADCSPAELEACGLAGKRALAMRRAAREVAAGRVALVASPPAGTSLRHEFARLFAIPEIGTWTVEMLALHGLGRYDVLPAGDLGYLKLVGRLTTGNPKAVADEAEVRGFFEPYAPWAGLAAQHMLRRTSPPPHPNHPTSTERAPTNRPAPLRAGTRWSAAAPRKVAA